MIGIIITGHGEFASGLYSSLTMIAGKLDDVACVTFTHNESEIELKNKLVAAITTMQGCDEIIIMCDLLGGSPFKQAATLSIEDKRLKVIYGVNLGMLLELSIARNTPQTTEQVINKMIDNGKRNIGLYSYTLIDEEEIVEGI
ncbi:MAG: PTS sugar transporter subunit IIA [Erysipelotrichaceae bacterium]|nr:PTS sugar transporter subunit IIA [Erysipelotrichaceae bacterium]